MAELSVRSVEQLQRTGRTNQPQVHPFALSVRIAILAAIVIGLYASPREALAQSSKRPTMWVHLLVDTTMADTTAVLVAYRGPLDQRVVVNLRVATSVDLEDGLNMIRICRREYPEELPSPLRLFLSPKLPASQTIEQAPNRRKYTGTLERLKARLAAGEISRNTIALRMGIDATSEFTDSLDRRIEARELEPPSCGERPNGSLLPTRLF